MKTNWVCFDCRHIARLGYVKLARCPRCQQPLQILAARLCLPPRKDEKAWSKLREAIDAERREQRRRAIQRRVRLIHDTEKELQAIDRRPLTKENRQKKSKLELRLRELKAPSALLR